MELKCPMAALFVVLLFSSSVCGALIGGEVKEPGQKTESSIITIRNLRFYPKNITISPGTTVVWVNKDNVPHKVVAYDRVFYGPRLHPGDQYSFTFTNEGIHRYFDAVFPKIGRGTIIVKEQPLPMTKDVIEIGLREEEKDMILDKVYKHHMLYLIFLQREVFM